MKILIYILLNNYLKLNKLILNLNIKQNIKNLYIIEIIKYKIYKQIQNNKQKIK